MFAIKTRTVHVIRAKDLEEFVRETFGADDWSFQADQEASNDSTHQFTVEEARSPSDYDLVKLEKFVQNPASVQWITGALLQQFHYGGLIPSGEYLVELGY